MDDQVTEDICDQITGRVMHVMTDKMYDTNAVFQTVEDHFPDAQ